MNDDFISITNEMCFAVSSYLNHHTTMQCWTHYGSVHGSYYTIKDDMGFEVVTLCSDSRVSCSLLPLWLLTLLEVAEAGGL